MTAYEMRISDWSSDVCSSDLEAARPAVGDDDALGGLEAPVVEPQAGHEVQRHARLQLGGVAAAQAHGALAPVGRVAEADGIAGAVVLHDAVARQHGKEGLGDVLAAPPRPRLAEPRFHALRSEEHTSELQSLMRISY